MHKREENKYHRCANAKSTSAIPNSSFDANLKGKPAERDDELLCSNDGFGSGIIGSRLILLQINAYGHQNIHRFNDYHQALSQLLLFNHAPWKFEDVPGTKMPVAYTSLLVKEFAKISIFISESGAVGLSQCSFLLPYCNSSTVDTEKCEYKGFTRYHVSASPDSLFSHGDCNFHYWLPL